MTKLKKELGRHRQDKNNTYGRFTEMGNNLRNSEWKFLVPKRDHIRNGNRALRSIMVEEEIMYPKRSENIRLCTK
jgi:hypothetical protein